MEALLVLGEIGNELGHRDAEFTLLLRAQVIPVASERREDFTRRHRAASCARPMRLGNPRRSQIA